MPPNGYGGYTPMLEPTRSRRRVNGLLAPFAFTVIALLGMSGFAIWSFAGMQDYKANTNKKISAAVQVAKQEEASSKENEFNELQKSPLQTYKGPATYGSIDMQYPKNWSAFITESSTNLQPIDGYLHPNFVPGLQSGTAFALRIQVTNTKYADELNQLTSNGSNTKVKVTPFRAAKVPDVLGSRIEGEITIGQKDTMIMVPIRDKTLKVWTESNEFLNDFETSILPNLLFVP